MKTIPRITPELHRQIWQNLKNIEQGKPAFLQTMANAKITARKRSPENQFHIALNKGDEQAIKHLLEEGLQASAWQLGSAIRADINARDTVKIFTLLLDNFTFPTDEKEKGKLALKLFNQINDHFGEALPDKIDMIEALLNHGLTPPANQWIKVLFDEYDDEETEIGNWFIKEGLWKYQQQCQSFFTTENINFALNYGVNFAENPTELVEKLNQLPPELKANLVWKEDQRHELLQPDDGSSRANKWTQSNYNRFVFNLEQLGCPIPMVCQKYDYQANEKKTKQLKNVSVLMEAMLDNNQLLFNLCKQDQTLRQMLKEDIQHHPGAIVAVGVDVVFFPYLLEAGFDFKTKNSKRETIFFDFFSERKPVVSKELHAYLVDHCEDIVEQKNTSGKTCFTIWKKRFDDEIKVSYHRKSMPISAYKALVIKEHLKAQLPAQLPNGLPGQRKLQARL